MQVSQAFAIAAMAAAASSAYAATEARPELLSLQYINEGSTTVALPTVKNVDGSICVSYIQGAERVHDGKSERIDATVKSVCGEANASNTAPKNLLSMRTFENDGLVVQLPTIRVALVGNAALVAEKGVKVSAPSSKTDCDLRGVSISGNATIRCVQ